MDLRGTAERAARRGERGADAGALVGQRDGLQGRLPRRSGQEQSIPSPAAARREAGADDDDDVEEEEEEEETAQLREQARKGRK